MTYRPHHSEDVTLKPVHDDGSTGWPPSELMQDGCRKLSKWFASKPDARRRVREAADDIRANLGGTDER